MHELIKALLFGVLSMIAVSASELRLASLRLPLYFHSDADVKISDQPIPFVTSYASPEALLAAMSKPFVPHHDSSWNSAGDVNLVTIYKLRLSFEQVRDSADYLMTIDASGSKRPDGMPFTIAEVVERTRHCATLNFGTSGQGRLRFSVIGLAPTNSENESG